MDPRLIDSSALSEIPTDITFKFTEGEGGEIKANKSMLAMVSKVFRHMFFINNTKDKSATEMVIEDTTKPAFQIMLDAVHNVRSMKESLQEKSVDEVFAVLYLVNKYEIPQLLLDVKECLSSFPITENNVLEVATDALEYTSTFGEATQILLLACAKFLKPKVGHGEWFVRFVAENGDRMATVQKLAVLMKDMPPYPTNTKWCDGCHRISTECVDGKNVTKKNVKVGVKVIAIPEISYLVDVESAGVGVAVRKHKGTNNWVIRWGGNNKIGEYQITDGGLFLFKCH